MSGKELKQIEKRTTRKISFDAMKFGSERDLRIALTELKWIERTKGKLIKSDFEIISDKYEFPIDFLKEGLKGFSYPEDFMVSKSKWFPIIYSWMYNARELGLDLFKFQIDYVQTLFRFSLFLVILGIILFQMGFTVQNTLDLDWLQFFLIIILPFVFFFISLGAELRNSVANKKMKLEEYSAELKEEGFHEIITTNEEFIRKHYWMIALAGGTFLKNIRKSSPRSFFYIGMTEVKKPAFIERERVPIFYGENPYNEYRKRIEELSESKSEQK